MKKPLQFKQVLAALLTIAALASGLTAQATVQTGIMMQGLARTVNNQTMCTFVIQSDWGGDQIPAQTGSSYTFSNARMIHGTVDVTLNGTLNFQMGTAFADVITGSSFTVTIESSSLWFYGATVQTKNGTNVSGCSASVSSNRHTLTVTIPSGKTFGAVILDYVSNPPMTNSNTTVTVPAGDYWVSNANLKPQPEPTVVYGQTTLVKDTDYTLSWSNNSSAGTGTVTVTGIGNYAGSATGIFYIRWAIYYVHFDKNHDDATRTISDQAFIYNTAQALTANTFSRTGYSFVGWSTTSNGAVTYTDGQSVSNLTAEDGQTVTLYAQWAPITYNITYDLAGGSVATANPTTYNIETATFTLNNPTREGYTFAGWTGTDLTEPNQTVTIAQGSIGDRSYTATWSTITYNITYDLAGGSVATANPTTYNIETATFTLNNPTRTGYTFAGWTGTDLDEPTMDVTIAQGSIGDRSFTANWTPITYNISYDLAGGSVTTANPTTYNIETATFTLNNPTRTGYTFAGWTGTDLDEPTMDVTIAQGSIGDRSFTANWNAVPYNLTYDLAGGSVTTANPTTYNIETETFTLNTPTRFGCTFAGWTGTDLTEPTMTVTIAQGSTGDRSYTATWTLLPVTYIDADGVEQTLYDYTLLEGSDNGYIEYGEFDTEAWYVVAHDVTYNYCAGDFLGSANLILMDGTTLTVEGGGHSMPMICYSDLTIYAQSGGTGAIVGDIELRSSGSITIHGGQISIESGYIEVSGGGDMTINGGEVSVTTAYGTAIYGQHVVINGGNVTTTNLDNDTGIHGSSDVTINGGSVSVTGTYAYAGASYGISANNVTINGGIVSATGSEYDIYGYNVTINGGIVSATDSPYGIYARNNVTINGGIVSATGNEYDIYVYNGITLGWTNLTDRITANSYRPDVTITIKDGQTLWNGSEALSGTISDTDKLNGKTLEPCFSITYDLAGGSVATANPTTYTVGSSDITLNNPTRAGYTFAGWTGTDLDEPTMTVTIVQGSTGDRSYTATWTLIPVTYIDADGNQQTCTDFTIIESSESDVNLGTSGQDEWYVVSGNVTINGQLFLSGFNSHLILCDGATLNINHTNNADGLFSNNLIIYGQSVGNGTLTASAPWSGIHTNNNLTINGGIISATSTTSTGLYACDDLTINRGSITAHGHYDGMWGQNVIINGGIINATNGEGSDSYGIKANLDITLGYTELIDRITASSYNSINGTISVKAGQALYDGTAAVYSGTLNSMQIDAIAGQTLEPCFILTLPELVNATGVISQEDTTAYALAGAEITLAAAEGYEITDGTTSFTMPAQNVVSDVTVQIITYNITYDLAGGSVATANPTTYHIETAIFTLNNPTRTGYTFAGWTGTDLDEPTMTVTIAQGSTGDRSYTATWSTDAYTITYDLAGGSVATANPTTYIIETETFTLNNPTRQGYTFAGWTGTDLDEPTMTVTIAQGSTGDRSYTATWSLPPVTYIGADGVEHTLYDYTLLEGSDEYIEYGDDYWEEDWYVVAHDVTYNDGFAFFGIANLILMDGATLTVTNVSENHSNVSSNLLTIYVQSGGTGAIVGENTQIYSRGSMTILGGNITLSGYSHGLYSNYYMNIYGGQISIEAESDCIYAENDVTINGGEVSATMTGNGDAIDGYHVVINGGVVTTTNQQGYGNGIYGYEDVTINGGVVTANAPAGAYGISTGYDYSPITLGWTNETDRITVSSYYGEVTVATGQAFSDETGNYYMFTLNDSQVAAISGQTLIPFTDIDMPFSITYETDGGTLPDGYPTTYTFAETVTLPTPTNEDNFFLGWYDNADFEGYPVAEITAGTALGAKTFYAYWAPKYTNVTYLDADGQPQTVRATVLYGDVNYTGVYEGGVYTILAKSDYWVFYDLLRFTGDATLILPDEGELVIGVTKGATDEEYGLFVDGNLTIFGQEMGSGTLFPGLINAEGNVNIYGGRISCWSVIASNDGNGTITLSWTSPYNYISSRYSGTVVLAKDFITDDYDAGSPIIIPAGQVSDIATINGKWLYPYIETMDVSYIDENGATHTVNARVLYGGETTLDGGYYTYLGEEVYFRQTLSFDGNTTLIIPDDSYLYIDDWYNSGPIEGNGIAVDGNLSIYGQAGRDGHIDISATVSFYATGDVTVSNVDFYDSPYTTNGILCGGDILIAGGWFYSWGILNANDGNGTITLGYLTEDDEIYCEGYEGTVVIREGQTMQDWYDGIYSGTLTSEEVANIAGQDLVPYIEPITLTVEGYGESNGGWVFIASPMLKDVKPTEVGNIFSATEYDLYRFDQSQTDEEWQNFVALPNSLVNGQGYLYASKETVELSFHGVANPASSEELSLNAGWNLVGNPFASDATLNREYYVMNQDGTGINPEPIPFTTSIPPCTAVFVKAETDGETVVFSRVTE